MLTLNQIKQVIQVESDYTIKELKASSFLAVSRLYTEITHFFTTTTHVLKACVLVCVSHEITIKSDSEISEQHLQTRQDIVQNVSKVINFLNVVLVTHYLSSRDVTIFFNLEQSCFI